MSIKKVLHIAGDMNIGGTETLLMNINRNIDPKKLRFDYAVEYRSDGYYAEEIKKLQGNLYPFILRRVPFAAYWVNVFNLIKVIRRHGPYAAVHVHYTYGNWFFLAVARLCGIKKRISHMHTTKQLKNRFPALNALRRRLILFFATDLFACSAQAGMDLYGPHAPFRIINNGIDCSAFAYNENVRTDQRDALGLKEDFVLCCTGRLESYKNHTFLIDVFAEVCRQNPQSKLMLIGSGSMDSALKTKVKNLGLEDKVLFLGARADCNILLQAADIFVFPSLFEGFGMAAIEAQAAGLPCIISDNVPQSAEVVNCRAFPLSQGPAFWADEVLKYKNFARKDTSLTVKEAGFDIKDIARDLQEFYLK